MANFNKVILAGNMTRDPQLKYLPSNTPVAEFGMAINRKWRSQDGQQREDVCFVDCTAFGRSAETINQYMRKGQPMLVEGRLKFDQWEGKDGQKRSRLTVVVEGFQFLGGGRGAPAGEPRREAPAPASPPAAQGGGEYADAPPVEDYGAPGGENVPF